MSKARSCSPAYFLERNLIDLSGLPGSPRSWEWDHLLDKQHGKSSGPLGEDRGFWEATRVDSLSRLHERHPNSVATASLVSASQF